MSALKSVHVPHLVDMHVFHRNRLFLDCLASVLGTISSYRVTPVDSANYLSQAAAEPLQLGVALIDMQLPDRQAIELLACIKQRHPQAKCLVLVAQDDPDAIIDGVTAGAVGCVLEESSLQELCSAIDRVVQGETFCSPQLVNSMFQQLAQLSRDPVTTQLAADSALTRREHEILTLLAEGLSNQDIASQLSLSLYTVKNHVHNILEKLEADNRFHAIEHARRRRLLPRTRLTTKLS